MNAFLIGAGLMLAVGIALTWPEELRNDRWWKIGFATVVAGFTGVCFTSLEGSFLGLFLCLLLAHIWKGDLSHYAAGAVTAVALNPSPSIAADFREAQIAARDGDFEAALALARVELRKEPSHVEGLMLAAAYEIELGDVLSAIRWLDKALVAPTITEAQRGRVLELKGPLETKLKIIELNTH